MLTHLVLLKEQFFTKLFIILAFYQLPFINSPFTMKNSLFVYLLFAVQTQKTTADTEGSWRVTFPPFEAGEPVRMTVATATETLAVNDIKGCFLYKVISKSNFYNNLTLLNPTYQIKSLKLPLIVGGEATCSLPDLIVH